MMNDRMNESLSALVDGEADELEIRRVLNQLEQDDELRQRWNRYQLIGSALRGEPATMVDLSKGIMQALDGEPMDEVPGGLNASAGGDVPVGTTPSSGRFRSGWVASGAVAASVAFAVLLGARFMEAPESGTAPAIAAVDTQAMAAPVAQPAIQAVSADPSARVALEAAVASVQSEPVVDETRLREAQQRLHDYVMQHNQQSAMNNGRGLLPFARVTSYEQGQAGEAQR